MRSRIYNILFVVTIPIILTSKFVFATGSNMKETIKKELLEDVNNISVLAKANDINELEKLADNLEKKWYQKDKHSYSVVICSIATALNEKNDTFNMNNIRKQNNNYYELADNYVKMALDKLNKLPENEKISVMDEFNLTSQINKRILRTSSGDFIKEKDWPQERCEDAKYYFSVWERLEKNIIPNWDTVKYEIKIPIDPRKPPVGYDGPFISGMSTEQIKEGIKDPNLRAEYEAGLKKYEEIMLLSYEQYSLQSLKENDLRTLQRNIYHLYSSLSSDYSLNLDIDALKQDIAKYVKDEKVRKTILDGVKYRLADDLKPRPQGRSMARSSRGYRNPLTNEITEKQLSPPKNKNE